MTLNFKFSYCFTLCVAQFNFKSIVMYILRKHKRNDWLETSVSSPPPPKKNKYTLVNI